MAGRSRRDDDLHTSHGRRGLSLLRGVEGRAALVSRIGLALFVVFYGGFETLQGIGNGILVNELKGLPQVDEATRVDLVQDFAEHPLARDLGVFGSIGTVGFVTGGTMEIASPAGGATSVLARIPVDS